MRKIPNFVLLRAFEAAARLQSFSLAAHELHVTPSAISHQVRDLEAELGRALFVRSHRRVELTQEGRRLFERLTRLLDGVEACCAEVRLAPSAQVLSVHCAPSFALKWLGPRLPAFAQHHPDITLRLSSGADPVDLTQARDLDLLIVYGWVQARPGIEIVSLGKERILPLAAPTLFGARQPWQAVMAERTLIDSQLSPVTWRDWFALNGLDLPPRPRPSFDRAALSIAAAVDGMGMVLESARLAERELASGALVPVGGGKVFEREVHFLVQRSGDHQVDKIRRFREWLLAELQAAAVDARPTKRRAPKRAVHRGSRR